ncbi:MAG: right-handed parallel beta-helix repeat-containing protein, partial [Gemmatales bacterium]|nr:right-handed parallel beta-helix repeat-containing protein [Gemmatales bacterium]
MSQHPPVQPSFSERLRTIIAKYRLDIQRDQNRLKALVKDYLPNHSREVRILLLAFDEGVPAELASLTAHQSWGLIRGRLIQKLQESLAMHPSAATWAVDTWAAALGVVEAPPYVIPLPRSAPLASAAEFRVAPIGAADFRTLSEAVQHVPAGSRLLLASGTYVGGLVLDKNLEIVGESGAEVRVQATGDFCLQVRADYVVLKNLKIWLINEKGGDQAAAALVVRGIKYLKNILTKLLHGDQAAAVLVVRGRLDMEQCTVDTSAQHCGHGVVLEGSGTFASLSRCAIRNTRIGMWFKGLVTGKIQECAIQNTAKTAVIIENKAQPNFERCEISNSRKAGVFVHSGGSGRFENCQIHNTAYPGVAIKDQGTAPVFVGCTIRRSQQYGVWAHSGGGGRFENCQIHNTAHSGVGIQDQGTAPVFVGCTISDSQQNGVFVHSGGGGRFENCQIHDTAYPGVGIKDQGTAPVFVGCTIRRSQQYGVWVWKGASARFLNC